MHANIPLTDVKIGCQSVYLKSKSGTVAAYRTMASADHKTSGIPYAAGKETMHVMQRQIWQLTLPQLQQLRLAHRISVCCPDTQAATANSIQGCKHTDNLLGLYAGGSKAVACNSALRAHHRLQHTVLQPACACLRVQKQHRRICLHVKQHNT